VSYSINEKTVLRGGFGVVYSATGTTSGNAQNSANAGTPGFGQLVGQFKDGIPSNVVPQFPNYASNAGQPIGAVVALPTFLDPNAGRPAKQYQWSIGVQREITRNLVVEASYVGNRGVWWPANLSAVNAISQEMITGRGFSLASASDGTLLNKQISGLNAGDLSLLASRGVITPYSGYSTGQTVRQSLSPFPQYTATSGTLGFISQAPLGKTWYDGLQLNVTQRFNHGLSFNFNYTNAKALDLMTSPDIFNRQLGKNLQGFDIPQQLRMTAEYQTPKLRGNKIVSQVLGDWGIGWYFQYQSAFTLGRPNSQGSQPISQWLGRGPGPAQWNGTTSLYSTNWTDYDGKVHTDPIDVNCHCFDPTKNIVLNPAAWTSIPNGQWGAQQTDIRQLRNIRQPQENLNVSRNFRIKERVTLHIRAEFQNALNRTRLTISAASAGNGATAQSFSSTPQKFTTGANTGLYSAGFGTILPTSGTNGQRTGTLIARITF
jgi:hypothetical protein